MKQLFSTRRGTAPGFTIVELLIVVVVIAILAAITLIAFNNVTGRAKASAAASAAQQAFKKVAVYTVDNADQLPPDLATAGVANQNGTTYQYRTYNGGKNYCITATANGVSSFINNLDQTNPAAGACPGHVAPGQTLVTNYAVNPKFLGPSGPSAFTFVNNLQIVNVSGTSYAQGQTTSASLAAMYLFQPVDRWAIGPGQPVFIRATVRNPNAGSRAYFIAIRFFDSTGATLGNQTGATGSGSTTIGAGGTATLTASGTAPANTASVGISVSRDATVTPAVGDLLQATNLWLSTQDATFATGDSSGWAWNGTANNSTSTGPAL